MKNLRNLCRSLMLNPFILAVLFWGGMILGMSRMRDSSFLDWGRLLLLVGLVIWLACRF